MRVVLDNNKRALGMELMQNGKIVRVKADKEIVICCGTVMSPVVLMNSGVGPQAC